MRQLVKQAVFGGAEVDGAAAGIDDAAVKVDGQPMVNYDFVQARRVGGLNAAEQGPDAGHQLPRAEGFG